MQKALLLGTVSGVPEVFFRRIELMKQLQERIDVVNELPETYPYFFKEADLGSEDARTMRKKLDTNILRESTAVAVNVHCTLRDTEVELLHAGNVLSESSKILSELGEPWSLDSLKSALQEVASQTGCSGAKLMTPLRYALTGTKVGQSTLTSP